jgi:hypothetical protein
MDLIRKILLAHEGHEHGYPPSPLLIEGFSKEQIGFHVAIMAQGGLVNGIDITAANGDRSPNWISTGLTWEGYDFLDKIRDESRWEKIKKVTLERTGSLGFDTIRAVAGKLVAEAIAGNL